MALLSCAVAPDPPRRVAEGSEQTAPKSTAIAARIAVWLTNVALCTGQQITAGAQMGCSPRTVQDRLSCRYLGVEPQRRLGRRRCVEIRQHPGAPARADRGPRRLAACENSRISAVASATELPAEKRSPVIRSSGDRRRRQHRVRAGAEVGHDHGLAPSPRASRIARCSPSGWIAAFTTTVAAANAAGRSSVGPGHADDLGGVGREHQVPQLAGVAASCPGPRRRRRTGNPSGRFP